MRAMFDVRYFPPNNKRRASAGQPGAFGDTPPYE